MCGIVVLHLASTSTFPNTGVEVIVRLHKGGEREGEEDVRME